jgi:protein-S-isoprenylcysteine O-methyltransferase Ste14
MTPDDRAAEPPLARPTAVLQIGSFRLTGGRALVALSLILVAIVVLIVRARPALSNWPIWASLALWIAFVAYWSAAATNSAPTRASETPESRKTHERLLNAALLLLFLPVPGLRAQVLPHSLAAVSIGLLVQASFFALAVWARRHLGRNWSAAITTKTDHRLVRSGPYGAVRHPIYTAMLGMFVGAAIVSGTPHALLAMAIVSIAYARKIRLEERHLRSVFGREYDEYRASSHALIPWVL